MLARPLAAPLAKPLALPLTGAGGGVFALAMMDGGTPTAIAVDIGGTIYMLAI